MKRVKPQSPCKDCENRHVGCHSVCVKYQQYRQNVDDFANTVASQKKFESVLYADKRKVWTRELKKKKGK